MHASNRIAPIIGVTVALLLGSSPDSATSAQPPPTARARAIDRKAWARSLAGLKEGDWRKAFEVGEQLADLPPDEGFAILKENWEKITSVEARQQMLKAWNFAMPYPLHARNHPRLLDVLDLGMRDPSPEVQRWAQGYLRQLTFRDFSEDFQAYKAWYQTNRGRPLTEAITESVRRFVDEAAKAEGKEAEKRARFVYENHTTFRDVPEARKAALDAGLVKVIERWVVGGADQGATRENTQLAGEALRAIAQLKVNEEDLRRVIVPLIAGDRPAGVRVAAIAALERKEYPWTVDLLLDTLRESLKEDSLNLRLIAAAASGALANIGNPKVIPVMIGVIDADNTYDTVYGVGYFGLSFLTGVKYDESHNGAWWRQWWDKNKERYPAAVQAIEIPKLQRKLKAGDPQLRQKASPDDPLADVADVPAQDLRAGGDAKKRYFLIGAKEGAKAPAEGYALLIVLPGGDGSAAFHPFIRRIYKNVLNERWLIAQPVAPVWQEDLERRIVWPTEGLRPSAAQFTTEEFVLAILADVRAKGKIDPKRVFMFGWSSGGPPCYALALRKESPVAGAFIAMSVFKPEQLPALENARGKAFYLLQSPDDNVTPMRFAEAAGKALGAAGAKVRLERYEGGHGWHGDVWEMIRSGAEWLDK